VRLFRWKRQELALAAPTGAPRTFASETTAIVEGPTPVQARLTLPIFVGMFVTMLLITFCTRIDRVVSSKTGKIVTVEPTVVLSALDQSIIRSIDADEGQKVEKGELLATLDPTFTKADVDALQAQVAALNAQIARCEAELAQKPFDMPLTSDPVANTYISGQRTYYLQRKAQFDAQVQTYDQQVAQQKTTIAKYQADQARYADRAKISQEIEQMRAILAADQAGSRLNLLAATDQRIEIERALEFDRGAIVEAQHQLDATVATRDAFVQQWFAEISQEMVTAKGNRDAAVEQLNKATKHQELVRIEAPEESVVLKIADLSPLSVLAPGDPLITLAPLKSPFEAELHIAAADIGFVRVGDDVTLKLDPYNFMDHGTIEGKLKSISEGSFTTDDSGDSSTGSGSTAVAGPYYKVRVALGAVDLRNVPSGFRLLPGTTLKGDVHIGTRSLFTYIFGGIQRGFDQAMREP
jgi:hemolysin D